MFVYHLFITALTAAHIYSASAFQLGSDYNVYKTTNLYNCTGHVPVSNVTVSNAIDTLPQIEPSSGCGWEQWTLSLHGTFTMIMRWNQGDPSSSTPTPAYFDVFMDINGTTVESTVIGELSYTNNKNIKQIIIGGNTLTWDSDGLWYNASINIDSYQIQLNSFSATLDSFHPNVAFYNGLLDQPGQWFGSVPMIRAHVSESYMVLTKQNVTVEIDGLTVLRHMFSENPLPSYIKKYSGGTIWGYSTSFYDSQVFYHTETTNGSVHEAALLGRAIPNPEVEGDFSSAWATYAVTDDQLYTLSIGPLDSGISTSFSGCADANNNSYPYQFNTTALVLFAVFPDLGGGVTSYYMFNGTTSAPFNDVVKQGTISGFFEEYEAPATRD